MRSVPTMIVEALRSLKNKPFTVMYPFERRKEFENFRGKPVFYIDRCISCSICAKVCPSFAIEMIDLEGKKRPRFSLGSCIFCFQCAESCPTKAIESSKTFELADTSKDRLFINPGEKQS